MENPLNKFNEWWSVAEKNSPLRQKNAVCISTVKDDGFPSGRFVDLKAVDKNVFILCTFMDSNKGIEIFNNPKVAMTVWWGHVGLQVRVIGVAKPISDDEATTHWRSRTRDAQLTTLSCKQSAELKNVLDLQHQLRDNDIKFSATDIPKPQHWAGIS